SSNSQNLGVEHGKLLRVRRDGTIPPDNPFLGVPGARPAIFARGLRNPFRIAVDPLLGSLWIGDVGGNSTDSHEEINLGVGGANYGWPDQEGPNCYVSDCSAFAFPAYSYPRSPVGEASITLGPVYRGSTFPAVYVGNLLFADYTRRWTRRLLFDGSGFPTGAVDFDTAPDAGTLVDLDVGPDGALYTVAIGFLFDGTPTFAGVQRIAYSAANQPPTVVVSANPTQGPTPLTVQFSSAGTIDPDSGPGPLSYAWTFGDGGSSSAANPSHVYAGAGRYTASLDVSDGAAQSNASLVIQAGSPPIVQITQPQPGATYRAGDTITFSGTASDPPFGNLGASAFTWRVLLRHAAHVHPFLGPFPGITMGTFQIPTTGHSPEDTFYDVVLDATDSDGLITTSSASIFPVLSTIDFDTQPSGIPIFVDGDPELTPRSYDSLPGFAHVVEAQSSFVLGGISYAFDSWSDGGARVHAFTTPEGGATLVALYTSPDDVDSDGVSNAQDSCPTVSNLGDPDGDSVDNACDNCLDVANPPFSGATTNRTRTGGGLNGLGQLDDDADGRGNACDMDYNQGQAVVGAPDTNLMVAALTAGRTVNDNLCGPAGASACGIHDHSGGQTAIGAPDTNLLVALLSSGNTSLNVSPNRHCGVTPAALCSANANQPCCSPFSRPIGSVPGPTVGKAICLNGTGPGAPQRCVYAN
ncbi:MAG: PQQ-dependent sugar dehydrogenase, partial [Actinobacteria bacterium]|nr:PQQ-dependent sugar dehydrogenase [Actinomycetota bacterium]